MPQKNSPIDELIFIVVLLLTVSSVLLFLETKARFREKRPT
jgi:hypothetical protein